MGSKKSVTVGYRYYLGLHFGLCHGPVDSFGQVDVGDRTAWSGNLTASGSIGIVAPEIFGGDKREGGIVGILDVAMGEPTQMENSYLVSQLGAAIPAFRGILSVIWRGGQVTANNPYVKPWAFRVKRILQGWSTGAAWYPEKAEITGGTCTSPGLGVLSSIEKNFDANQSTAYSDGNLYAGVGNYSDPNDYAQTPNPLIINCSATDTLIITVRHDGIYSAWSKWTGYGSGPGDFHGSTDNPLWNCEFTVKTPGGGETTYLPTYYMTAEAANAAAIAAGPVSLTGSTQYSIWLKDSYLHNRGGLSIWATVIDGGTSKLHADMNPAHIIYQCLTNSDWGMGYPTSAIDNTSFTAVADTLYAEQFGLSFLWNQQENIENFVQIVLDHIGALLYVRSDTSTFAIKLIRSDYNRAALPIYGSESMIAASDYQRQAWGETINEITVVYTDTCSGKDVPVTAQDMANIQIQGGVVAQTRNYPGIRRSELAQRVALRDLQAASTPLARIKLTATRALWQVFPGDVFRLSWPEFDIADVVFRALAVNRGTLQNGEIVIDAVEDVFGLPDNTYLADQPGEWIDPSGNPVAAPYRKLLESPYWDIARNFSAADMAYVDALSGYVETLAARPSSTAVNYRILAKVGSAAYEASGTGDFCPSATLVGAMTKTTTAITLDNGVDLDLVSAGSYAIVNDEYILILDIDTVAGTATVSRGILDTVPVEHPAGARLWFADGFHGFSSTEYTDGESVDIKLLPTAYLGELDISLAPVDRLVMSQRQYRPYPPGNLLINTQPYPEWIDGYLPLSFSWAHRDRLLQTAYMVEQNEASIGPEAGTTYTLRLYGETDALLRTETGLTGTSYTWADEEADSELVVPGAAGGDGYWSSRVALLHFGGVDGSTAFVDEKGHTFTAVGNAQIDTAQSLFGGASGLFDGAGDYIWAADSADWDFGTGDFTIQIAVRFNALPSNNSMTLCGTYGGSSSGWSLQFRNDGGGGNRMLFGVAGDTGFDFAWSPATGTWYTIEVNRSGDSLRAFVGGTQIGSTQTSIHNISSAAPLWVGGLNFGGGVQWFNGWCDELRITKGRAEHTANYTPDAAPFPGAGPARPNGRIRVELEAVRDGKTSYQKHNVIVDRAGYGYNWGKYWGGPAP